MSFWFDLGTLLLAVFGLFLVPGLGLTWMSFRRDALDLIERLVYGFCLGLGLFFVLYLLCAWVAWSWDAVRWLWTAAAIGLTAGGWVVWRREKPPPCAVAQHSTGTDGRWSAVLLGVLVLAAALTVFTARDEDDWTYYQITRQLSDASPLTIPSLTALRSGLNAWWAFHAFLLRVVDADIVHLGRDYLPLLLVPLALTALYALARTLLPSRKAAVAACGLQLALYIVDLFYNDPNVQLTGGWVLGRIDQDHTAVQFILLPVYAAAIIRYLQGGGMRWLAASFLILATLSAVHPQGFVQAGIMMGAFLPTHLLFARTHLDWKRTTLVLVPFVLVLFLLIPFILFWSTHLMGLQASLGKVAADQVDFPFTFRWVFFYSPTTYTLRPDLLGYPSLLAALLLLPVLARSLRRELGARYLLSYMLALLFVLYTPILFARLGDWLGYSIYRLWYLFPSALVIVYLAPRLAHDATNSIAKLRARVIDRSVWAGVLGVAGLVLVLTQVPVFVRGAPADLVGHSLPAGTTEILTALRNASSEGEGVVLAPRAISDPIPAYRATLEPVLFRYQTPQERVDDANTFYSSAFLTVESLRILSKYRVGYLIAPTDQESISQFDLSPLQFVPLYRNTEWALYRVRQPLVEDDIVRANTEFMHGDWQRAIDQYHAILAADPDNSLAHTGLGVLLEFDNQPQMGAQELEEAVRIEPANVQAHYYLARIFTKLGMVEEATEHAAAAGRLAGER